VRIVSVTSCSSHVVRDVFHSQSPSVNQQVVCVWVEQCTGSIVRLVYIRRTCTEQ